MLVGVGYFRARHTHAHPVRTGLAMTLVGKVMREVAAGLLEFCVRAR